MRHSGQEFLGYPRPGVPAPKAPRILFLEERLGQSEPLGQRKNVRHRGVLSLLGFLRTHYPVNLLAPLPPVNSPFLLPLINPPHPLFPGSLT